MADVEHRLSAGCSEKLQLGSLVAAFDSVKYLVAKEVSWEVTIWNSPPYKWKKFHVPDYIHLDLLTRDSSIYMILIGFYLHSKQNGFRSDAEVKSKGLTD